MWKSMETFGNQWEPMKSIGQCRHTSDGPHKLKEHGGPVSWAEWIGMETNSFRQPKQWGVRLADHRRLRDTQKLILDQSRPTFSMPKPFSVRWYINHVIKFSDWPYLQQMPGTVKLLLINPLLWHSLSSETTLYISPFILTWPYCY